MLKIPDIDALLLLAALLATKRRPASPEEIVAATEVLGGGLPEAGKLSEALTRLTAQGLLDWQDEALALTPAAQAALDHLSRKGELADRLARLKDKLAAYAPPAEGAAPESAPDTQAIWQAALNAPRAGTDERSKNLLMPKPATPEKSQQRPGQHRRKPLPGRRPKG